MAATGREDYEKLNVRVTMIGKKERRKERKKDRKKGRKKARKKERNHEFRRE